MKKKISIPIIPIVIIILLVIAILVVLAKGEKTSESKLQKVYNKMVQTQSYSFSRYDLEEKNKITTSRKSDKTLIDMYNSGEHISTLILNGDTYLILHANKEYYVYENNNNDEGILTDELKKITELDYVSGKEKIYGRKYSYEEYADTSYFAINTSKNMDEDSVKTRFYFKGNDLVYLKTIYDVVDEETGEKQTKEELQTVEITYDVEDSIFNIPENYAEN